MTCKLTPKLFRNYMASLCPISKSEKIVLTGTIKEGEFAFTLDEGQEVQYDKLQQYTDAIIKKVLPKRTYVEAVDYGEITLSNSAVSDYTGEITFIIFTMLSNWWIIFNRDNIVKQYVERYIRRPVCDIQEVREFHSGNGGRTLQLNRAPVNEVTMLRYIVSADMVVENFSTKNFELDKNTGLIRLKGRSFFRGNKNIEVRYSVGQEELQDDILSASLALLADVSMGHLAGLDGGSTSFSTDGFSKSYGSAGKWTQQRKMQGRIANDILGKYASAVIGG